MSGPIERERERIYFPTLVLSRRDNGGIALAAYDATGAGGHLSRDDVEEAISYVRAFLRGHDRLTSQIQNPSEGGPR